MGNNSSSTLQKSEFYRQVFAREKKQAVVKENKFKNNTNKYDSNELITTSRSFSNF